MNKNIKTGVFLARMQPVHNAHLWLGEKACKENDQVIVIDKGKILFDGKVADLVKRYVNYKVIHFEFKDPVRKGDLVNLGKLEYFDGKRGKIHVKREDLTKIASKLLKSFPIEDIDIEEVSLEDIVRTIFNY